MAEIKTAQDAIEKVNLLYVKNREESNKLKEEFRDSLTAKQLVLFDKINSNINEGKALNLIRHSFYGNKVK